MVFTPIALDWILPLRLIVKILRHPTITMLTIIVIVAVCSVLMVFTTPGFMDIALFMGLIGAPAGTTLGMIYGCMVIVAGMVRGVMAIMAMAGPIIHHGIGVAGDIPIIGAAPITGGHLS